MDGDDSKDAGTGAMSVDTPGHAVMSVDTPKTASNVNMRKPLAPSKKTNTMSRIAETAMTVDSPQNLTPETRRLHSIFKDLYEAVIAAVNEVHTPSLSLCFYIPMFRTPRFFVCVHL